MAICFFRQQYIFLHRLHRVLIYEKYQKNISMNRMQGKARKGEINTHCILVPSTYRDGS